MPRGSTVFAQIMFLILRRPFNNCVARYNGDYRVRNLSCYDQFLVMSMAQYANKNSLRYNEAILTAFSHKLYHSSISYAVPRHTLAKANEVRDWRIYSHRGRVLIDKVLPLYTEDPFRLDLNNAVYASDCSTISLCMKLCPWAKFRKTKAGVKMHTQLVLRGNIPVFIHLTDASVHDVRTLDELCVEMGAIYLLDKGYVDSFRLFNRILKNGAFFVTRAKNNMQYEVMSSSPVDKYSDVLADEIIKLTSYKSSNCYPEELRFVTYKDFFTGVVYRFRTNHMGYEALTIAEPYRERWNVEQFFKWIKKHLHIKSFYGTFENAVYTQIWIAFCAFLLIAYAKKKWNLDQSLYTISQTIGFVLFAEFPLNQLFNKSKNLVPVDDSPNLFSIRES